MVATRLSLVALVAMSALPAAAHPQDLAELVRAGRFEEAAATLSAAGPEEAEEGAKLIFNEAYTVGFQRQDYQYAIRGVRAAKTVPNLSQRTREMLDFWHGLSVLQATIPLAQRQDLEAARASLPGFMEAQWLLRASGTYPEFINAPIEPQLRALEQFIAIQEAIIRRGY